ncbi:MAG TPA: type II toxin-antitoxin system RelE/ParE family toxin [Bacteroidota bacterium]|nr:type II toxin-antitoxin system RelE/ParE family toxin [Bacteroidota bacterium]
MAEINWTSEAQQWLRDIHDYIAEDNPAAALSTVEAIFEKSQILQQFPEVGYRYQQRPDRNIRVLLFGHYRITYLIKPDGNIDILGVFHGALDIDKYLL